MQTSTKSRSFSYAIFSFVTDTMRGTSVPVGVALWSPNPEYCKIRLLDENERTKGLPQSALPFVRLTRDKISGWIEQGVLPYAKERLGPTSSEWWRHASKLLIHNLRISEPLSIDCLNPDEELELLFEAIVSPVKSRRERVKRVDGVLTRALGDLAGKLPGGQVPGFQGREVFVHRHAEGEKALLIVEAVNLASTSAENDADSLVSRLLRIREANGTGGPQKRVDFMVGYLSSPQGLNGEATLRDWIEKKTDAQTFDLINREGQLREAVSKRLAALQA